MELLAESHLACHTFPEHGSICLNLFCCKPRPDWDFAGELATRLGARAVKVRSLDRPYGGVRAEGDAAGPTGVTERRVAVP